MEIIHGIWMLAILGSMFLIVLYSQHVSPKLPNADSNKHLPPHLSSHPLKLSHRPIEEEGDLLVGPPHGSIVARGDNVCKNEKIKIKVALIYLWL